MIPLPESPGKVAEIYLGRGLCPIPVQFGTKRPACEAWQSSRVTRAAVPESFPAGTPLNVGVLNGTPSGHLVDVDLDWPEARLAAPLLLPETGWVFGRATSPMSHWLYRSCPALDSAQVDHLDPASPQVAPKDRKKAMIVEMRGTGGMTVFPGSTHEGTGERIAWGRFDAEPADVALGDLARAVREVAAAALLARYAFRDGDRHGPSMALAGGMLRRISGGRWNPGSVERFVQAVAAASGSTTIGDQVRNVRSSVERLQRDEPCTGWPDLENRISEKGGDGQAVVRQAREWLDLADVSAPATSARSGTSPKGKTRYRPLPPFVPFPLQTLPPVLTELVSSAATAIGCDPALVALPALAVAAGCVGNARAVLLKRGWIEPCVLWTITVADSGGHKSPAYSAAAQPMTDLQMDVLDGHALAVEQYEEKMAEWAALDQADRAARGRPEAPPPPDVFWTSDPSIEKFCDLMARRPKGMIVARDELDAWFGSFTRYKGKAGGSDRAQWLEMHRAGPIRIDRLSRPSVSVRRASLSLCGTIQPGVLVSALSADALQSGLGARFLMAMPPRRKRVWTEAEIPDEVVGRYASLLASLLALPVEDPKKRKPFCLGMSLPARRLWIDFYDEWGGVQFGASGEQAAAFAKIEAYASRLMLLHHVVSHVSADVDDRCSITEASARAGIELARWFAAEAVRVYGILRETAEEADLRKVVEWIADHGGSTTVRDLQKSNSRKYPHTADAESALQALADAGLGDWRQPERGRSGGHAPPRLLVLRPPSDTSDTFPDGGGGVSDTAPPDTCSDTCSGTPEIQWETGQVSEVSECRREVEGEKPYLLVRDGTLLATVANAVEESSLVALDVETTGLDPRTDRVRILTLSTETDGGRYAYLVDCFAVDPSPLWEALSGVRLVIHNAAFDLGFLARMGFTPGKPVEDTMVLAQLLVSGTFDRVGLADCSKRWLGRDIDKAGQKSDWSGELAAAQLDYAALDVELLPPLLEALRGRVDAAGLTDAASLEMRCLPSMVWMAGSGVGLDEASWRGQASAAEGEAARLRLELDASCPMRPGEMIDTGRNWDSPQQVAEALTLVGCPVESTSDEALAAIDHPMARLLRQYRGASKKVSSFGAKWLEHVREDGRVYPGWKQIGAASGRMACRTPNMQQLPRGDVRRCVVAPAGRVLVKADYSQIELRIAAKVSGDESLLGAYQRGDDLHALTARNVLGAADVTKGHRQLAKALNFGLLYGMGAKTFREYAKTSYGLDLSPEVAATYRQAFFTAYPGLAAWHRKTGRTGKSAVETRTLTGRRRLGVASFSEKLNTPIQGTGADGLKIALALLWERRDRTPGAFPVLAVHDEIVVEADAAQAGAVGAWLRSAMVEAMAPLVAPVPVEVDVTVGQSWGG